MLHLRAKFAAQNRQFVTVREPGDDVEHQDGRNQHDQRLYGDQFHDVRIAAQPVRGQG